MKFKILLLSIFLFPSFVAHGQDNIIHKKYFSTFFDSTQKAVLIIGENHASSVSSKIYPTLIRYLNKKNKLRTLLIEFGPSEAYFYTKYLQTGDEKYLNYTIYAGYYRDWRKAWRKIYTFNKGLDKPLNIIGIDFDRTRTFGYALYNIFKGYPQKPAFVDSLMEGIKDKSFYKIYTNGYPTHKDKKWTADTKKLLDENRALLKKFLNKEDFNVIQQILQNKAVGYGGNREVQVTNNTVRAIKNSGGQKFLLLMGRDHAYLKPIYGNKDWLAGLLQKEPSFSILTGVLLYQNSQLWGKDYKKAITLHEIKNKKPWKAYASKINAQVAGNITVIPLTGLLSPLKDYTDYIIVARNQGPIDFFK